MLRAAPGPRASRATCRRFHSRRRRHRSARHSVARRPRVFDRIRQHRDQTTTRRCAPPLQSCGDPTIRPLRTRATTDARRPAIPGRHRGTHRARSSVHRREPAHRNSPAACASARHQGMDTRARARAPPPRMPPTTHRAIDQNPIARRCAAERPPRPAREQSPRASRARGDASRA